MNTKDRLQKWLEQMMTPEQRKVVVQAYNHLMESEKRGWDCLDDYIEYLGYLTDDQLFRESDVIFSYHERGTTRCKVDHPREKCFVPIIVEAAGAIIELYKETNNMHENNKYILQYYLAMNQAQMILMEASAS